jgi:hypothetical protein
MRRVGQEVPDDEHGVADGDAGGVSPAVAVASAGLVLPRMTSCVGRKTRLGCRCGWSIRANSRFVACVVSSLIGCRTVVRGGWLSRAMLMSS